MMVSLSHGSLRNGYEVRSEEMDLLVESASESKDVLGEDDRRRFLRLYREFN